MLLLQYNFLSHEVITFCHKIKQYFPLVISAAISGTNIPSNKFISMKMSKWLKKAAN